MGPQDFQNRYNQANTQAQNYQNQLAQFQASARNPMDYYKEAETQLGVGDAQTRMNTARQAVNQTNQLLANLPGAVQGQVNGTLTNESQRQALLGQRQQPLMQNFNTQSQNYGDLANQYSDLQNRAQAQAQMGYQGQQSQLQGLQGMYSTYADQAAQALQAYQQAQAFQAQQEQARRAAAQSNQPNVLKDILNKLMGGGTVIPGGGASTSPQQQIQEAIRNYLPASYATDFLPGYTERTVLPQLQKSFGSSFTPDQIKQMVYGYRKQFEQPQRAQAPLSRAMATRNAWAV